MLRIREFIAVGLNSQCMNSMRKICKIRYRQGRGKEWSCIETWNILKSKMALFFINSINKGRSAPLYRWESSRCKLSWSSSSNKKNSLTTKKNKSSSNTSSKVNVANSSNPTTLICGHISKLFKLIVVIRHQSISIPLISWLRKIIGWRNKLKNYIIKYGHCSWTMTLIRSNSVKSSYKKLNLLIPWLFKNSSLKINSKSNIRTINNSKIPWRTKTKPSNSSIGKILISINQKNFKSIS